jgi:phosphoglycerate dehydrogenase-like enzyme
VGSRRGDLSVPAVLCLRPLSDFTRVGVAPPEALKVTFMGPADAAMPAALKGADALLIPAVGPKLPLELFSGSGIRLVQVTGAGVDRVDHAGLKGFGIPVANVPGGSNDAVAEYAVSSASVLLRRFLRSSAAIRAGRYGEIRSQMLGENLQGLDGLLVGIVGMGVIGKAVAERFRQSGARIAFHDPAVTSTLAASALGAEMLDLDTLLRRADVVSLHVPLLPSTENLIDAARLASMKAGAVLIQASRGGIVDEAALAAALEDGHLGGAAVDVYSSEPPTPDNPLLKLSHSAAERTLLTPHIAGVTRQASTFLFRSAWENVARVLVDNQPPRNVIQ